MRLYRVRGTQKKRILKLESQCMVNLIVEHKDATAVCESGVQSRVAFAAAVVVVWCLDHINGL